MRNQSRCDEMVFKAHQSYDMFIVGGVKPISVRQQERPGQLLTTLCASVLRQVL